ncbi:hypothetical protein ACROYT_G038816 [Oculina patagonica]
MRTPVNVLLVNLVVADFIYAMFITPRVYFKLHIAHHPDGMFGTVLCKLVTGGAIAWTGSASSIFTLVAIAFERYYVIINPFHNKWNRTKHKMQLFIPATWVFALVLNLPLLLVNDVEKDKRGNSCKFPYPKGWMRKAYSVTWLVLVFVSVAVMAVLYSRVVHNLWLKCNDDDLLIRKRVTRVRKRVTLTVLAVTFIFGICWGIGQLIYVLLDYISEDIGAILLAMADTMILFNSTLNPFVYALLNKQFREKLKKVFCCTGS